MFFPVADHKQLVFKLQSLRLHRQKAFFPQFIPDEQIRQYRQA